MNIYVCILYIYVNYIYIYVYICMNIYMNIYMYIFMCIYDIYIYISIAEFAEALLVIPKQLAVNAAQVYMYYI